MTTIFIISPKFEVQVDNNDLIQVMQEGVVKRRDEEKIKVESTESRQVKLHTWLYVWKVCLSSRIRVPNHNCLVDWPVRGVQFFYPNKEHLTQKVFS